MRRVRVAGLAGDRCALSAADEHHLRVVLRLARGARLVAFGDGWEAEAELLDDGLRLLAAPRPVPSPADLHLVFALPKGPPLDHLLRMTVEVGVTHLHPVRTERTVPRGDHPQRWMRILVGAAEQCGRADVPTLADLATLPEAAASIEAEVKIVAVPGAAPLTASGSRAALAIGPEGGLTEREIEGLVDRGWVPRSLGPYVMRVDTAAAVGLALLRSAGPHPAAGDARPGRDPPGSGPGDDPVEGSPTRG